MRHPVSYIFVSYFKTVGRRNPRHDREENPPRVHVLAEHEDDRQSERHKIEAAHFTPKRFFNRRYAATPNVATVNKVTPLRLPEKGYM